MAVEWLAVWGVAQTGELLFRPVLEDLADELKQRAAGAAKDAAENYVHRCFKSVFSVLHRDPLAKATGRAVRELLELIEDELRDAQLDDDELQEWIDDIRQFTRHEEVPQTIGCLFLEAEPFKKLDPGVFARVWQDLEGVHRLPDDFDWQRVVKRLARRIAQIRESSGELRETVERLASAGSAGALEELKGLPPDFNLDAYREALVERFANLDFAMLDTTGAYYSGIKLWNVFVPQAVRECHGYTSQILEMPKEQLQRLLKIGDLDAAQFAEAKEEQEAKRREYLNQPPKSVLELIDDGGPSANPSERPPLLVLLGDPGSGKSSLLRFLALQWAHIKNANERYTRPLPLLIELRDYSRWKCGSGKSFLRYLHEARTWHRLNRQTLDHFLRQPNRVVLLLDGLDEIFDRAEREWVVNDIHRFSNEYPGTCIVLTSRVVGYQPKRLQDAEFRHFMLQDLDEERIQAFLDRWHDATFDNSAESVFKRQRLATAIEESKAIAMLAGNPLLLTMMAILNRYQDLPRDRSELYNQATRVLLHQWDTERALDDYPELRGEVDLRAKTAVLRSVAFAMQNRPEGLAGNIIDGDSLTRLIETYLRDELRFDQARAAANALVRQLRERNFLLCYLGADCYAFVHRTFLEYFCAADVVHRFHIQKSLDVDGLIALFDQHCRDDDWREVLRLICGQIDGKFVGRIVEHLATRMDWRNWDTSHAIPELPLALLCLSEKRPAHRPQGAAAVILEATNFFFWRLRRCSTPPSRRDELCNEIIESWFELRRGWPQIAFSFAWIFPLGNGLVRDLAYHYYDADDVEHAFRVRMRRSFGTDLQDDFGFRLDDLFDLDEEQWEKFLSCACDTREQARRVLNAATSYEAQRGASLVLSQGWPDESTRRLLEERVWHEDSRVCTAAIEALGLQWPDETTRTLLVDRAIHDKNGAVRGAALDALGNKWPDETTRMLLVDRAVEDGAQYIRLFAMETLTEKFLDETTRKQLLKPDATSERDYFLGKTLQTIAERWPDGTTRKLLVDRAVEDEDENVRKAALDALVNKWPNGSWSDTVSSLRPTNRAARNAGDRDAPIGIHILWMIRRDMPDVLEIENRSFEFSWSEEDFIRCLRQRNCIGMVAEHDERVVGFMIYELHKNRLHILNFAVHPEFRRRGVGTGMIRTLIGKLSPQRRNRILLEVREANLVARRFLKSCGFRWTGVLSDFYQDCTEDAYLMEYRISDSEIVAALNEERESVGGAEPGTSS